MENVHIAFSKTVKNSPPKNTPPIWAVTAVCLCIIAAGAMTIIQTRKNKLITENPLLTEEPIQMADTGNPGLHGDVSALETAYNAEADEASEQHNVGPGIFIPTVELPETTEGATFDMIGLVVYKGAIYTQAENYFGSDAMKIDGLVGKHLGHATGSINEWSSQDEYAKDFASSVAGEVYEVLGYNTDFRICIRNEFIDENGETELFIEFLDCLNGITLTTGADLFETRLHIRDRISEIHWQCHNDWDYGMGDMKTADLDPALWEQFLDQTDKGVFVNTWDPEVSTDTIYDTDNQAHIFLTMEDGTVIRLRLIAGGYVGYEALGWYFIQVPGVIFETVFTACGGCL